MGNPETSEEKAFGLWSAIFITNSVEDMQDPKHTMLRSMCWAIGLVAVLYIAISIAVFGNLPLDAIIKDKDYALAEAAKPAFGVWGFKIMAATALGISSKPS